jgi:hypothetical protein
MSSKDKITKTHACERSKVELAQLYQVFNKYLCYDEDNAYSEMPEDGPFGGKVKIANKLYRQACVDSGVSFCFFKNFKTWQQFVHGEIEETEFYVKALEEIREIGVEQRNYN